MARTGEDVRLTQMLLEVAAEMDAEADAIEAATKRRCKNGATAQGKNGSTARP
jgi:hypothetical protein